MPANAKKGRPAPACRQLISRKLREAIRDDGASAYSLGREAGIDPGMIQRFLNEERDIRLETVDRLAEVLGLRLVEGGRGRARSSRARGDSPGVARRTKEARGREADSIDPADANPAENQP